MRKNFFSERGGQALEQSTQGSGKVTDPKERADVVLQNVASWVL